MNSKKIAKSHTIFQCIPCYKPIPTIRIIRTILKESDSRILLDIEDSIGDMFNKERNIILKRQARIDFREILNEVNDINFDIRINPINSIEFTKDHLLITPYLSRVRSVLLPKTEELIDLDLFYKNFPINTQISLIIESEKGIKNLEEILHSKYRENIEYVFFGNYDYHLSQNIFPINEQYSEKYWEIIKPIISITEKNNCKFGNSPYTRLNDFNCLNYAYNNLISCCTKDFAVMSLHKKQTLYFSKIINNTELEIKQRYIDYPTRFIFDDNKLRGRSFALDKNQRIITPQEQILIQKRETKLK